MELRKGVPDRYLAAPRLRPDLLSVCMRTLHGGACGAGRREFSGECRQNAVMIVLAPAEHLDVLQARYAEVLAALDAELRAPVFRQVAVQLAPVVDPKRSAVFDRIKY